MDGGQNVLMGWKEPPGEEADAHEYIGNSG